MTPESDRLIPRTHRGIVSNDTPAGASASLDLLGMENDVRASREMADALYALAEHAAVHGATERDFAAIVRCASVLQDFTTNVVDLWERARQAQVAA